MSGYVHHLAFDFKSGIRDTTLMLMNYLFPIGFFVMIGLFMPTINPAFLDIMIPGLIVFAVMSGTLMTIPGTFVDQRNSGILRSYRVNGVPAMALITIPILGALVHMLLVSGVLTAGGSVLFGAVLPGGLMVPSELLPEGIARGASLLPATQAMRALNALAMGNNAPVANLTPVVVLMASILLNIALSFALFRWNARTGARRDLLALLALSPFALSALIW